MFRSATSFNQDISGWLASTPVVTNMTSMFRGATSFNQDIGGWDVSTNLNFGSMFRDVGDTFDQDIGDWDVSAGTNFNNMFNGSELSPASYNALLIGWSALTLQINETAHFGTSQYCSTAAIAARTVIDTGTPNWNIIDGGQLTSFTWSGTIGTDWSDTKNWQDGYAPSCNLDITIPNTAVNYPIIASGTDITVNNLTIESGATLTIEGGLTVDSNLITNNGLTINSAGSIIVTGTSTGNLKYIRNLIYGEVYQNISVPVVGETIENYIATNPVDTGNGNVGLYYYDNNTTGGYAGTGYVFYQPTSTGPFISGKGYGTRFPAPVGVEFTGTMPTTDVSIAIATGSIDNSNLIGNPFPSYLPLNTNAVATNNLLTQNTAVLSEETAWFWDPTIFNYVTINQGSAAHFVPPAQGFFVEAGGGTFNFLESWQSHQATDVFYRTVDTTFRINLSVSNQNNLKKTSQIFYIDNKTIGFDNGYDSSQFVDESASLAIYSRLVGEHNSQDLAIQTLPTENLHSYIIPIGVKGFGELTFNAEILNIPNDIKIFLEDRYTNTFMQLENAISHTINVGEEVNGIGRFYLHLENSSLNVEENSINNVSIYNSGYKEITINGVPFGKGEVAFYDILGKEIVKESFILESETSKKLSLLHLKKGFYIVKLKTEKGSLSKKIIFK